MENQKFTYSLGSIPGFTARTVRLVEKVYLQIKAQYFDGPAAVCKRRFIYLWKKPKGSDSWQSVGLFMTDDYGILFELEPFLEAIDFRKENTSIFKYDPAQQKFTERPWSLYGDAEDIIALQKHLSEPLVGMEAKSSNATEVKFNNTSLFMRPYENNEFLYRDPFVVNDKYKYPFVKGTQYFMMFFPPHVVGRSAGVNTGGKITIDQPPQLLIDNSYIVEPEDTIQDICSKFNLAPTFNLAGYKNNRDTWDEMKKRFKPGAVIAIPPQARGPLGFGRLIELLGIDRKVKLSSDWFHVDQSDNGVKDRTPVLSVELPVTLEEHTALMTENLALLDMTWSVLIEAAKPFARAANQVRSIAELVDIMRRYPGYRKRQVLTRSGTGPYYSSVEYREKESYSQTELDIVNDAFNRAKLFENDLMLAAFNDQNPIFNREKEGFYALISEFEQHIKSNSLRLVLGQWATHVTSGTSATYPYLFPAEKTPLFFDILARSFQTLLSIRAPYPIQHSSEELRTVGDAIFENILSRFELHLQAAFQVADRTGTIQKAVLDEMKTLGLVSESTAAIFDKETYLPKRFEDGGDLLAFIFSDIVLKKGIAGMDSCVKTILKAGTEFRTKMIRYHCQNKRIKASFAYFKIAAGLKLRSGKASSQVINDAKAGLSFLSKERKRYANIAKDLNIRSKKHFESITAVPQLSLTANAITAGMAIYSIVDFANKLQTARNNNQKVSFDDWIGLASSLHSFGTVAAGFTNSMLRATDAVF
ncbi:MAG: hypothetical protein GX793_10945, partial [Bacteroidales bacterium]|nr:hypothetical protein [Bacteroidales bacterium]